MLSVLKIAGHGGRANAECAAVEAASSYDTSISVGATRFGLRIKNVQLFLDNKQQPREEGGEDGNLKSKQGYHV